MLEYSNLNRLINFEQATRLSQSELKYSSIQIRIFYNFCRHVSRLKNYLLYLYMNYEIIYLLHIETTVTK